MEGPAGYRQFSAARPRPATSTEPVCILGMHRSGTSMITRMLGSLGVHLGPRESLIPAIEGDNPEGYWEHQGFIEINDAILAEFGGTWHDLPQLPDGWTREPALRRVVKRAERLIEDLSSNGTWGWKDPRTCVTLPFWQELLPNAHYVLCVRHPLEVAQSFAVRIHNHVDKEQALGLWERYYDAALSQIEGAELIVTHYDSYLYDSRAELQRLSDHLGLKPDEDTVQTTAEQVQSRLAHGFAAGQDVNQLLSTDCRALYTRLCAASGPVFHNSETDEAYQVERNRAALRLALLRIDRLEGLYHEKVEEVEALRRTNHHLKTWYPLRRLVADRLRHRVGAVKRRLKKA